MQHQLSIMEENSKTNATLIQLLERQLAQPSSDPILGVSRRKPDAEALAPQLTEFTYDPEFDSTFENWYRRYEEFFKQDAANLDEPTKVRLLLRKLETSAHNRYINFILPKLSSDFNFIETVQKLKQLFGKHESLLKTRFNCFKVSKKDEMNFLDYTGTVNKACESFELNKMSIDQFKCLIFVTGLTSPKDLDIRTKLLSKLETEHDTINLEKLSDEYGRLTNLKRDTMLIQNQSILVNQVLKMKKTSSDSESNSQEENTVCESCGTTHDLGCCPAGKSRCSFCNNIGHWQQFCRKKLRDEKKMNSKKIPSK